MKAWGLLTSLLLAVGCSPEPTPPAPPPVTPSRAIEIAYSPTPQNPTPAPTKLTPLDPDDIAWQKRMKAFNAKFDEPTRRKMFTEMVAAEDALDREEKRLFPDPDPRSSSYVDDMGRVEKQRMDHNDTAIDKVHQRLARKYRMPVEDLVIVSGEAYAEKWPMPPHK